MQIIIITGFLGSGNTTLLLEIAKKLSEDGKTIQQNVICELEEKKTKCLISNFKRSFYA